MSTQAPRTFDKWRRGRWLLPVAIATGLLWGCSGGDTEDRLDVADPTVRFVDVAPMAQPVELAFGAASLAAARAPGPGDGDAALEVPGTQLAGSVRFRFADYASIGFGYAAGLDASAQPIRPHQAPVDGGDAVGIGTALTVAVPVAGGWSIGVDAGVVGWEVPWIEHSTCVANCPI